MTTVGPSSDSLIYRFTVAAADTYYVHATGFRRRKQAAIRSAFIWKTPGPPPPPAAQSPRRRTQTTLRRLPPTPPSSWARGAIPFRDHRLHHFRGTLDYYSYKFTAGNLVTVNIKPTGTAWSPKGGPWWNASGTGPRLRRRKPSGDQWRRLATLWLCHPLHWHLFCAGAGVQRNGHIHIRPLPFPPTPPPVIGGVDSDYFSLTLAAGQSLDSCCDGAGRGENLNLTLVDVGGNVLATGRCRSHQRLAAHQRLRRSRRRHVLRQCRRGREPDLHACRHARSRF